MITSKIFDEINNIFEQLEKKELYSVVDKIEKQVIRIAQEQKGYFPLQFGNLINPMKTFLGTSISGPIPGASYFATGKTPTAPIRGPIIPPGASPFQQAQIIEQYLKSPEIISHFQRGNAVLWNQLAKVDPRFVHYLSPRLKQQISNLIKNNLLITNSEPPTPKDVGFQRLWR